MSDRLQLFQIPFAGGSETSFIRLNECLNPEIEAITLSYAGRGKRHQEPFIEDYDKFLNDLIRQISKQRNDNENFALLGYSMGSALAYDMLSRNLIKGYPVHVFLCSKGIITRRNDSQYYINLSDEEFINHMVELGGIDERILRNKRFLSIYMKPVREDYIILESYRYHEGRIPCDASVIYSPKDPVTEGAHDWGQIIAGKVAYYEMGDNHFFINEYYHDVAEIINHTLSKYI